MQLKKDPKNVTFCKHMYRKFASFDIFSWKQIIEFIRHDDLFLYIYSLMFMKTNNIWNMYKSILLNEKNSIYFFFKKREKFIKIEKETAPLKNSYFLQLWVFADNQN